MSPLYLLDTNVLIHYLRRGELARQIEARFQLYALERAPLISYVSTAELHSFSLQMGWGEPRREQLAFLLTQFPVVPTDAPGVRDAYVALDVYSRAQGVRMGKNDLWIAASAVAARATLLTLDRDFDHLQNQLLQRIRITEEA